MKEHIARGQIGMHKLGQYLVGVRASRLDGPVTVAVVFATYLGQVNGPFELVDH